MKARPITTLFMLMSADGKISTGATDELDFDRDFPLLDGLREGLHQYYEIEQTTDLWSLNSGRVQAKLGVNELPFPAKSPVSFVLIDNRHLNRHGVEYFCARAQTLVIVTSNERHPALQCDLPNLHVILQQKLDLAQALQALKSDFGCERVTLQTGGTLNGLFLREGLIDYVDIVVAPVLVGGGDTATLIDGRSLLRREELNQLGVLRLSSFEVLDGSYLRLRYEVVGRSSSDGR